MTKFKILKVGRNSRELGTEEVIEAMFTTIGCRLEPQGRGTRFPAVMEDLSSGYLKPSRAPDALRELQEIEHSLRKMPVGNVVWSLANRGRRDDANEAVNHHALNAFDYFVDVAGRPLISSLREGVQECQSSAQVLRLAHPNDGRIILLAGFSLAGLGLAWMLLGRAFVPHWVLVSGYSKNAALPIWTFGMDFVMLGVAIVVPSMFPSVGDWFRRRVWAINTLAITAVLGWLAICACAGFLPD